MLLIKLKIGVTMMLAFAAVVAAGAYGQTSPSPATQPPLPQAALVKKPALVNLGQPPLPKAALVKKAAPAKTEEPPAAVKQGQVQGRITAADSGKPLAGATVQLYIRGVPGKTEWAEAVSDAEGKYTVKVPFGEASFSCVYAPAGYYTVDFKTSGAIITTRAEPQVIRDFVLRTGSPWKMELHGAGLPLDKPTIFDAWPERGEGLHARLRWTDRDDISVRGDDQGKAVLTIPTAGGCYRLSCAQWLVNRYRIDPANLEIDENFDPCHIKGLPESATGVEGDPTMLIYRQRKAVRLHDTAGRSAIVMGAQVLVEAGQAVIRFNAQPITLPTASAFKLRGAAEDEAGKPVAGAKFTAAFYSSSVSGVSQLEAMTDALGKFQLTLPESEFADERIRMIVVKSGYDGAQTKELNLVSVKKAGSGDFGTVILKPGHKLRGKVVGEDGQPVEGACVFNMTNYFLYAHLCSRTDAEGRFVMPDLSFGRQKIQVSYGERYGTREFQFDARNGECLITVRPMKPAAPTDVEEFWKP